MDPYSSAYLTHYGIIFSSILSFPANQKPVLGSFRMLSCKRTMVQATP